MSVEEQHVLDCTGQKRGDLHLETGLALSLNVQQSCIAQMSNVGYRWGHTLNSCRFLSTLLKKAVRAEKRWRWVTAKLGQTLYVFGFHINYIINGWMFASLGAAAVLPSCKQPAASSLP